MLRYTCGRLGTTAPSLVIFPKVSVNVCSHAVARQITTTAGTSSVRSVVLGGCPVLRTSVQRVNALMESVRVIRRRAHVLVRNVNKGRSNTSSKTCEKNVPKRHTATAASVETIAAGAATAADVNVSADRLLGYWLLGMSGAVFGMVAVGGYTRLTRSGLSMTEWRLTGSKLPSTDEEWTVEFDKYKAFPEYQKLNQGMTLDEFKDIYFWEWFHRMWGVRSLTHVHDQT